MPAPVSVSSRSRGSLFLYLPCGGLGKSSRASPASGSVCLWRFSYRLRRWREDDRPYAPHPSRASPKSPCSCKRGTFPVMQPGDLRSKCGTGRHDALPASSAEFLRGKGGVGERGNFLQKVPPFPHTPFSPQKLCRGGRQGVVTPCPALRPQVPRLHDGKCPAFAGARTLGGGT